MSKVKSPQEKKTLSLKKDRRNVYGECPASSRKNIRRGKQFSQRRERHAVAGVLNRLRESSDENAILEADSLAKTAIIEKSRKAFKKMPDAPLGVVIQRKQEKRRKSRQQISYPTMYSEGIFDVPYEARTHKRMIMFEVHRHLDAKPRWSRHKKKPARISKHDLERATLWKDAILRDAMLLRGFFTEEPECRDKMLRWCEKTLQS